MAIELGRRGAALALVARGAETLEQVVSELRQQDIDAHGIAADVGDPLAATTIAAQAQRLLGGIDVLINNASTLGPTPLRSLNDTEPDDMTQVFAVNLLGPFRLMRALAPAMALAQRHAVIVNISSDAATSAYPTWGAYGASKAALEHLTRIWAAELPEVAMLSIDPGEMRTQMHADAMPDANPATLADPAEVAKRIADTIAGHRLPSQTEAAS